jgi:hypothetical protein
LNIVKNCHSTGLSAHAVPAGPSAPLLIAASSGGAAATASGSVSGGGGSKGGGVDKEEDAAATKGAVPVGRCFLGSAARGAGTDTCAPLSSRIGEPRKSCDREVDVSNAGAPLVSR